MKTTFIYALCEPGTRTVRYIGKADDPKKRLREHRRSVSARKKNPLGDWLGSLLALGIKPEMVVLREVLIEQWELAEERFIRLARGCGMALVNSNDGGGGPTTHTPETCEIIRKTHLGVPKTPEHRSKIRDALQGVPKTPEHRAALTGLKRSPEQCVNIGKSHLGIKLPPRSPEYCAAVGDRWRGVPKTPEQKAKISKTLTGRTLPPFSPEHCAALSAGRRAGIERRKQRDQEIEWALAPYTLE